MAARRGRPPHPPPPPPPPPPPLPPPPPPPAMDVGTQFRKMDPKEFAGTSDPLVAEGWIRSLEVIFRYMKLGDPDRVRCAVFLLQDDAALWWEGVEKTVDPATLPWTEFKRLFFEKYFTGDVRARLKTEFMSLRQEDLSVAQFVVNFERGCHFVPLIGGDEEEKLQHFIVGLRPAIRRDVLMVELADYASALRRALRSEQTLRDISAEAQGKRPFPAHGQQHSKRPYHGPPCHQGNQAHRPQGHQAHRPAPPTTGEKPICKNFHKAHFGKCLLGAGVCYRFKRPGHVIEDCPEARRPATGRVFVMQAKEADPDTTLITGRILVVGVATKALLDSGATHSFIFEAFVLKWGIQREELLVGFSVIIPSWEELTTKSLVKNLELLLQGQKVVVDLIVLPMPELDLILRMDWMVKNAVVIDFQQRSVLVRPEGVEPFWFEAAKSRRKAKVISFLQAKQLVSEGCETFLASLT
ncbi:uncharacterized protein [Henckelia pumila]|uniref:uncharacterized protein n=1 Tax=Henckelia pumila TaxID=405737 RepID=UPI003C6E8441